MPIAYLLLGSNIENKITNLENAKNELVKAGIKLINESSVYETEPWGFTDPENFLNQAIEIDTVLKPDHLLRKLKIIEKHAGRVRKSAGYEARIIDLDILLYEDEIIRQEDIRVPHPLMHQRRFALVPLCEIAPSLVHPEFKKEMRELLAVCSDNSKIWLNRKRLK
jgi:2-amino-4-hydroxy-6-hydroxymethyldihydropteridine diphosphokinase